jgi:hypothetical protein
MGGSADSSGMLSSGSRGGLFDLGCFVEDEIDLGHFEAGQLDLEVHVDERLQLDR